MAVQIGRDKTNNIPNVFLDSGTPAAPARADPTVSRAPPTPPERAAASTLDIQATDRNLWISRISKDFQKFSKIIIFTRKIEVVKSVPKRF